MKKRLLAVLLAAATVLSLVACGGGGGGASSGGGGGAASSGGGAASSGASSGGGAASSGGSSASTPAGDYKVAMVTDYGDITDQSFNQTTYEAVKDFAEANNIPYKYYKPTNDATSARVQSVELAVAEGYNIIVMPGYAFGGTVVEVAPQYPDVKFIALDVAAGDLLETAVANKGETYSYNPDDYNLADYVDLSNVYCAVYQEELCGYMAGYAAVKLGYTKLGFLGGMAVPAVMRYGYGYVQGVDAASKELGITTELKYVYANQFSGDPDIKAYMDTIYSGGTEIVFASGGGVYTSAVDAAKEVDGAKIIGVDVDQQNTIAIYASGVDTSKELSADDQALIDSYKSLTVTSAMKGLRATTMDTLEDVILNGNWDKYVGKIDTLGLVSGDDPEANYVGLPMASTQFEDGKFSQDDYKALVKSIFDGTVTVSNDISVEPTVTNVNVSYLGNIK